MKKINFLIVMALATQGSSLAGKGPTPDFGAEVIDGDIFFDATQNLEDYHGVNDSGKNSGKKKRSVKKRINRLNKARNAALEGATGQNSDEGSTDADISDTEKNISILANQAMNLVNDPTIQDLPDFKIENKGVLSVLWGKPIVKVLVLAAVVVGSVYFLSEFGISQEIAERMNAYVNTLPQGTQDQLRAVGNSLSNIDFSQMINTVKSFLTNNASAAGDFFGKQSGALIEGAKGLGYQGYQALSSLSQYAPSWESVQGRASQGLSWSKENATPIIESVKGTLSDALGKADITTRYAVPTIIDSSKAIAPVGLGYGLANLKNWWSGGKDVKSQESSGQEDVIASA